MTTPGPGRGRLRVTAAAVLLALAAAAPAGAAKESLSIAVTEPKPATLQAELFTPRGGGPHPAVILLHGCSGITPNVPAWALWLQSRGYAALILDSFSARGLRNLCGDSRALTPAMRFPDVFAAAARLKTMGDIDGARLAAIGFSHGGSTVLAAWRAHARYPDAALRALIGFYPGGCQGRPASRQAPPLLILAGALDDWSPPGPCEALARAAGTAGVPLSIVVYPDARHHFDGAHVRKLTYVSIARGGKGATMEYNPKAHEDAEKQVKQFLDARLAR